jgi:biotin carboxylase
MNSLADDNRRNVVIYINDFYPEFAAAFTKLSEKLGRPLRGIMLIDADSKASGRYRPDKDKFFEEIIVDFSDDVALKKAIKPLEDQLLVVSCDSERSQLYFKRVIPHVPYVNTPTESSIDYSTDKGKMRELLISYDPSISPKAIVVHDATQESITKVCAQLDFPLIAKPTNLAASMLVNRATDENELRHILTRSFKALDELYSEHRGLGDKTMVVEEFIDGDLYSTDAYVDAVGEVYVLPFIYFQNGSMVGMDGYQVYRSETHHTLSDQELAQGAAVTRKAIHAVGLRSSVAHVELFHTAHGWKIVELAARPGGWRQETYEVSYGIDHALNELLVKIGLKPEMPTAIKTHSATFRIHAPEAGIIDSITGIEEARNHPQMHTMLIESKPGDKALPSTHGGDMLVGGLMHNTDRDQLSRDIDAVRASITVNIKQI